MPSPSPYASTDRHPGKHPLRGLRRLLLAIPLILVMAACSEPLSYHGDIDDPYNNFDRLVRIVGDRYCFFRQKNIDWDSLASEYRATIKPDMSSAQLFFLMGKMLDHLRDGHVNLSAPFATTYYKKWWSDYPQDFNNRTLQQYYLKFGGLQIGSMTYCIFMPDSVGYVRIPSFSSPLSATSIDYILAFLQDTRGLIIDVRDNGGGYLTNVPEIVGRFIDTEMVGEYIRHKTGPEPDAFSQPFAVVYKPASSGHIRYLDKPVAVLTNRSCYSAANDFVAVMKQLPQVRIVGATTGGGGGMPFSSELPNGWSIRFSACPINDAQDITTEFGIDPSPGCEVHCTESELAEGKDAILDFAFKLLAP